MNSENQSAGDPLSSDVGVEQLSENTPPEQADGTDTGLHCLVMLAKYFEKPANVGQLRHARGKSGELFDEQDLLISAKEIGLKARAIEGAWERLGEAINLPAIAELKDGSYVIFAKINDEKTEILIHNPLTGRPEKKSKEEIAEMWADRLIVLTTRSNMAGDGAKFDVSWFIPAITKFRRMFSEVLVASFFIQVLALISPLFFMVIIDKVLTHRGLTSLDVLIFALVVISVFEVLLGGLRTYLFSHTTNRIDVQLGAKLFKHLMSLPISYFGVRRVGETVARVRELENVRNFLTGSALTLVVDLAFTVVFFAVMFKFSPTLTYIVLASIPFYVVFSLFITPILRARVEEKFKRGAENQAFLVESVTGVETLKAAAVLIFWRCSISLMPGVGTAARNRGRNPFVKYRCSACRMANSPAFIPISDLPWRKTQVMRHLIQRPNWKPLNLPLNWCMILSFILLLSLRRVTFN